MQIQMPSKWNGFTWYSNRSFAKHIVMHNDGKSVIFLRHNGLNSTRDNHVSSWGTGTYHASTPKELGPPVYHYGLKSTNTATRPPYSWSSNGTNVPEHNKKRLKEKYESFLMYINRFGTNGIFLKNEVIKRRRRNRNYPNTIEPINAYNNSKNKKNNKKKKNQPSGPFLPRKEISKEKKPMMKIVLKNR